MEIVTTIVAPLDQLKILKGLNELFSDKSRDTIDSPAAARRALSRLFIKVDLKYSVYSNFLFIVLYNKYDIVAYEKQSKLLQSLL